MRIYLQLFCSELSSSFSLSPPKYTAAGLKGAAASPICLYNLFRLVRAPHCAVPKGFCSSGGMGGRKQSTVHRVGLFWDSFVCRSSLCFPQPHRQPSSFTLHKRPGLQDKGFIYLIRRDNGPSLGVLCPSVTPWSQEHYKSAHWSMNRTLCIKWQRGKKPKRVLKPLSGIDM